MSSLRSRLRAARHALPWKVEGLVRGPDGAAIARMAKRLREQGIRSTAGFFSPHGVAAAQIVEAYRDLAQCLGAGGSDARLSIKAPKLDFDLAALGAIADLGLPLVFDAHGHALAQPTHEAAAALGAGIVLPARWQRSRADAAAWWGRPGAVRLVKGEWADPQADIEDRGAAFMDLAARLAGRSAPVSVATHDPVLARRALKLLSDTGTPCELELLRGLPGRRCQQIAQELGVPVRIYLPFGDGWWSYAIDQALGRPHLPWWWVKDRFSAAYAS